MSIETEGTKYCNNVNLTFIYSKRKEKHQENK